MSPEYLFQRRGQDTHCAKSYAVPNPTAQTRGENPGAETVPASLISIAGDWPFHYPLIGKGPQFSSARKAANVTIHVIKHTGVKTRNCNCHRADSCRAHEASPSTPLPNSIQPDTYSNRNKRRPGVCQKRESC